MSLITPLRVTYDAECGAAYAYLHPMTAGCVARADGTLYESVGIVLDFGHDGQLLGVEFLQTEHMPPEWLASAIDIADDTPWVSDTHS